MKKPNSVREPIQVYLDETERSFLDEIAAREGVSRSEVLRRSVRQYRATRADDESPMLRLLNDVQLGVGESTNSDDAGPRHDELLADAYSYAAPSPAAPSPAAPSPAAPSPAAPRRRRAP